uniref:Uncharacterized protein n=1 Tax=Leersia perrieri TaxID=77586 RepID=A0A0D9VI44_9ORYZ
MWHFILDPYTEDEIIDDPYQTPPPSLFNPFRGARLPLPPLTLVRSPRNPDAYGGGGGGFDGDLHLPATSELYTPRTPDSNGGGLHPLYGDLPASNELYDVGVFGELASDSPRYGDLPSSCEFYTACTVQETKLMPERVDHPVVSATTTRPQLCAPYDDEIEATLRVMEENTDERPINNFLENIQDRHMTAEVREEMIVFMEQLSRRYDLADGTLHRAAYYLDRYLSVTPEPDDEQRLCLVAATAVFIAAKYEDRSTMKRLNASKVATCCGYASKKIALDMENEMLTALNFDLGGPTAYTFVEHFTRYYDDQIQEDQAVQQEAYWLADASLHCYAFHTYLPSLVAASSIFLARLQHVEVLKKAWSRDLAELTRYRAIELMGCPYVDDLLAEASMFGDTMARQMDADSYLRAIGVLPPLAPDSDSYGGDFYGNLPATCELYAAAVPVPPKETRPQLCAPYDDDIGANLRVMEKNTKERPSTKFLEDTQGGRMTPEVRAWMVDFMDQLSRCYDLTAGTVHRAVYYLDRYLSVTPESDDEMQLRLVAATCVFLASKYEDRYTLGKINASEVAACCGYTSDTRKNMVFAMENKILTALKYNLSGPTAYTFVEHFTRYYGQSHEDQAEQQVAHMIADESLHYYGFHRYLPSVVAASSIFLARQAWSKDLAELTGYKAIELKGCVCEIRASC